jgi:2-oxo-4-hydroxy-4-carboxy--5-ureidoimidazoline (OHCU) decarboxylase
VLGGEMLSGVEPEPEYEGFSSLNDDYQEQYGFPPLHQQTDSNPILDSGKNHLPSEDLPPQLGTE